MEERPIFFSAPMVRALLDGSKTQTRRVAKLTDAGHVKEVGGHRRWHPADANCVAACPYGQPGDRLWVREAWHAARYFDRTPPRDIPPGSSIEHAATSRSYAEIGLKGKLRPGMFMPRWASRINLEITGVRVERLLDISESDAQSEGSLLWALEEHKRSGDFSSLCVDQYQDLWESINGNGSWKANPWVWVVEFKRIDAA